jgi:AcrR family transcriptional regulator
MTESDLPGNGAGGDRPARTERRRRTEERILASARELFARLGFERTTIRAVATKAEVDPALVMQYFGSKRELFAAATTDPPSRQPDDSESLVETWVDIMLAKVGRMPEAKLAMLRSMLTHPDAGEIARENIDAQIDEASKTIGGPDATERAALIASTLLGVTICHRLLGLERLRRIPPQRIAAFLRPALHTLLTAPPESRPSD